MRSLVKAGNAAKLIVLPLFIAMLFASSAHAQVDVVVDGQFATGLAAWTFAPSTADSVAGTCGYNGVTAPGTETLTSTPGFPATGAATTIALGSVSLTAIGHRSCVLYQDIAIPVGATTATITVDAGIKLIGGVSSSDVALFVGLYPTTDVPNYALSTPVNGFAGRIVVSGFMPGVTLDPRTSISLNVTSVAGTIVRLAFINVIQSTGGGGGPFVPGAGLVVGIGNVHVNVNVFVPPPPVPVPTLSEWSLIGLTLLLVGSGIFFLRQRRTVSSLE